MAARSSDWVLVGSVISLILLLLMLTHLLSNGPKSRSTREVILTPPVEAPKVTNESLILFESKVRTKRQSPDALIDPYSLLGLLSFGTFIFTVLYNRYKMKGMSSPQKNSPISSMPPNSGMTKFGTLSQETIEQIMKVASKFIRENQAKNRNTTLHSYDYYDTEFEKRGSSSNFSASY